MDKSAIGAMIKTFYWHERIKSRPRLVLDRVIRKRPWNDFRYGNAGDIFAINILNTFYPGLPVTNLTNAPRILCVGSIGHNLQPGDVACGIGCRTSELPKVQKESAYIHALRGPISLDIFRKAGYDVSTVKFLADPGLLIAKYSSERSSIAGRVIFIPHYRERDRFARNLPKGIRYVDIDNPPHLLAKAIMKAECVYSSSLHGIIFAHALGRPCVFVKPSTKEPLLKFEDYYLSMGLCFPRPLDSIFDADYLAAPTSPVELSVKSSEIVFPPFSFLANRGIIEV
ncbi:polysaccharide pyruvyl transferase family protein [Halochromatium roseum]|uniref:polysaccharide pyruvyl transferase family protein n=1 Tax=Halochromatium roseum TaxID=391920 RepID=UPI0019118B3D|nr:polysaccharide pyruvyl transferase family protein [Halochromatium roseum]MBK5940359.1 hypothetical protein [Halochromatium roseum]